MIPKRSRPSWLDPPAAVSPPDVGGEAKPVEAQPSGAQIMRRVSAAPQSKSLTDASHSSTFEIPSGDDPPSCLVRNYLLNHACSETDLQFMNSIASSIALAVRAPFEVIGSFGDGTASKKDSSSCTFMAPSGGKDVDKSDLLDVLRTAGPVRGWTVAGHPFNPSVIRLNFLSHRNLIVHVFASDGDVYRARTEFVRVYTHAIEPRMSVLICMWRNRINAKLQFDPLIQIQIDYFLFVLLWFVMTRERLIPNLIESDTDIAHWTKPDATLGTWRMDAVQAYPRKSLMDVANLVACAVDPENFSDLNICPLTQGVILEDDLLVSQIFHVLFNTPNYSR
jgi:hypothetical protein